MQKYRRFDGALCTIPRVLSPSLLILASTALLTTRATANETTSYSYDPLGRLVGATHSGTVNNGVTQTYDHDAANNRTNVTVTGVTCTPGSSNIYAIAAGTTSWTVPAGVNCVTVYAIGAGGKGQSRGASVGPAQGGGGGGFAKLNNYATTPGNSIAVQVAAGGSGSQTYWVNAATLLANAGGNGASGAPGAGGAAGVGDLVYAGGGAGTASSNSGSGGGGAAGPHGPGRASGNASNLGASGGGGADGQSSTASPNCTIADGCNGGVGPSGSAGGVGAVNSVPATQGSNGSGGGGGGWTSRYGNDGSQSDIWHVTAGSLAGAWVGPGAGGGGGNTSGATSSTGASGGGYGGGGGAARSGGAGKNGIIVVVY